MKYNKFILSLIIILLLSACGAKDSTSSQPVNSPAFGNAVLPEHISSTAQPDTSGGSPAELNQSTPATDIAGYVWKLDTFSCSEYIDHAQTLHADSAGGFYVLGTEDDSETLYTVYHCNGSGEIQTAITLPIHGDQQTSVGNMGVLCGDDAIWFDYTVTNSAGGGDQRGDYSYYLAACDYDGNLLFEAPREEIIQSNDDASLSGSMVLYDNSCVVATDHQVFAIDKTGSVLWQSSTSRSLYQMCLGADNELYFATFADGDDLLKLDRSTHEISDSLVSLDDGMYSLDSGILGYDLLLMDSQGATAQVYGLDVMSGEKTPLFDLGALGILSIGNIMETSDGFFVFDYYSLMGASALGQLVQAPISTEVATLSLGVCGTLSATAESAIEMFNSQHTDAYLSVLQYDSTDALNLAIISGEGPDIICFDGLSEEDYARNGYLCDLYALLGSDTKSELVERYCQEYETDGKLYRISPVFCCDTLIGNSDHITSSSDSFVDLLSVARSVGNDCQIFSWEPSYCLQMLLQRSVTEFVDYGSRTCDFENEEFEALLALSSLGSQASEDNGEIFDDWLYELRTENLMNYDPDNSMQRYSVLGFPQSAVLSTRPGDTFGVYASSAHQDIACEFISLLLSEDIQRAYSDMTGYYPIMRDIYESIVPSDLQSEVAQASGHYIAISPVYEIVTDEAGSFFSGDQTAAQVAQHIQSRISIYLGEQG